MRLNLVGGIVAAVIIVALIIAYGSLFTVYQTRQALVVRLGQPVRVVTQPGLHTKIPLIDSVISIDKRILDLENPSQEVIASDQKSGGQNAQQTLVNALCNGSKLTKPDPNTGKFRRLIDRVGPPHVRIPAQVISTTIQ